MKKALRFLKKELMLTLSAAAAAAALLVTPPTAQLLKDIDWRTLGTLLMMLCVLEGFKKENVLEPLVRLASRMRRMTALSLFLVFGVFFTSMFVTNDVSLIIFVPLTILLFRNGNKERYILPVISMENIAAIRGSLLTPFGSPQNLFLYGQAKVTAWHFMLHMLPLCAMSAVLLAGFVLFLYRRDPREEIGAEKREDPRQASGRGRRAVYLTLFMLIIAVIVTRTALWPYAVVLVIAVIAVMDLRLLLRVDYVLIITFFCFFVFSSSIAANPHIAGALRRAVAGSEYWWAIGLSQIISNVPASIVLYPFSENWADLRRGYRRALLPDRLPGLRDQLPDLCEGIPGRRREVRQGLHHGELGLLPDRGDPRLPAEPLEIFLISKTAAVREAGRKNDRFGFSFPVPASAY